MLIFFFSIFSSFRVFKNTMGDRAEFVGRLINRQDAPNDPFVRSHSRLIE